MKVARHITTTVERFVLIDGPQARYTVRRSGQQATLRVRSIEFRFTAGQLTEIALTGPRLRDDGTEITWETPTHIITTAWKDTTPEWAGELMNQFNWSWPST